MAKSEQEQFLEELGVKQQDDVLEKPLIPEAEAEPEKEEAEAEEEGFKAKNRRERRLLAQNQSLREEAIAASARAQALSETAKFREEVGEKDFIKEVRAIYGDDEPGKKMASDILENTLRKIKDSAVQEAFEKLQEQQSTETEAVKAEGKTLDQMADLWEDEYDIDMSNDATRKRIFSLTEKLSSKDKDGNIKEYPDPDAIAEVFLSQQEKSSSRAKELASKGMVRSGASQESKLEASAAERYLRENGII